MSTKKPIKRLELTRETIKGLRVESHIKTGDSLTTPTSGPPPTQGNLATCHNCSGGGSIRVY